jgi:hypothetical protein
LSRQNVEPLAIRWGWFTATIISAFV